MAKWCLTKQAEEKLIEALQKEGDPQKMMDRGSEGRRKWFADIVGKENASHLNALYESRLLLKNQRKGLEGFIKNLGGAKEVRTDFLSKVERLNKALDKKELEQFLGDLVEQRLGVGVSEKEFKILTDYTTKLADLKSKIPESSPRGSKERLAYGIEQVNFENYVNSLKLESGKIRFREQPLQYALQPIKATPGFLKSMLSSFDDSFFGRQGIKTLLDLRTSHIWVRDFLKSFLDIGRELKGTDAMSLIKADVLSRPNALNGKYKALGRQSGLGVLFEEAFPSSLPERIPVFKRLYKASQSAYNGGALRMRADLADRFIAQAEKQGINVLDKTQGEGIGDLVSSMTGRGGLGRGEGLGQPLNLLFFSIRFLKANLDTLTAQQFSSKATAFSKAEARKNLLSMIGTVAGVMAISEFLNPGSTERDPRSTNFGKIKIFGRWTDITGGMGSMITLASRISPSIHDGQWGFWSKKPDGSFVQLNTPGYGKDTALDTFENYLEGKFSPGLSLARDLWKGQNYSGDALDLGKPIEAGLTIAKGSLVPITGQTVLQMLKDPGSSNILASTLLELGGFSTAPTTYPTNWNNSTGKELKQFKSKVGQDKFNQANDKFNQKYNAWYKNIIKSQSYKNLSDEEKQALITKAKDKIKQSVFKEYSFKYKQAKKTKDTTKGLLPK